VLSTPWVTALIAVPPALLVRGASSGLGWHMAAASAYLLAYVSAWRWIGMDPNDRAVWNHLRRRQPQQISSAVV
jgi:hypothetical protein